MRKHLFTLLFALCILSACGGKGPQELFIIDIEKSAENIDLTLSDILEDLSIVALETSDDVLISGYSGTFVTDKYILATGESHIHLFDKEGRHIKKLLYKGNGPNEYLNINAYCMDEEKGILYYTETQKKQSIFRVSLPDGTFLEPLSLPFQNVHLQTMDKEGFLYFFPKYSGLWIGNSGEGSDSSSVLIRYHPVTESFQAYLGSHPYETGSYGYSLTHYKGKVSMFNFCYSDTLFNMTSEGLVPRAYFPLKDKIKSLILGANKGQELLLRLSYKNGDIMSLSQIKMDFETSASGQIGMNMSTDAKAYYLFNKQGELQNISNIHITPLSWNVNISKYLNKAGDKDERLIPPIPIVSGNWGYISVSAVNMISILEKTLEQKGLSSAQTQKLRELEALLTDDSNPVLILGRLK
jgi:hypothetical protein